MNETKKREDAVWTKHYPSQTLNKLTRIGWLGRQWQWFYLLKDSALLNDPKGKLPNSDAILFQAAKVEDVHRRDKRFRKLWQAVKAEFKADGQWLILPEMWKQLQERREFSKAQSERGKKSAEARKRREKGNANKISWNGKEWFPSELEKNIELANNEIRRLAQTVLNAKSRELRASGQAEIETLKGQRDSMKRALFLPAQAIEHNIYSGTKNGSSPLSPAKISGAPDASMERTDLDQLPASQFSDSALSNALSAVVEEIGEIKNPSVVRNVFYDGDKLRPQFVERLGQLEERERELLAEKFQREQLAGCDADELKKKSSKTRKSSPTSAARSRKRSITTTPATGSSLPGLPSSSEAAAQPASG